MPHPETKTNGLAIKQSFTPTALTPGIKGQIAWDSGFIYVCTATNTWKKAALSSV